MLNVQSEDHRQQALDEFVAEWEQRSGPADKTAIEAMVERYGL